MKKIIIFMIMLIFNISAYCPSKTILPNLNSKGIDYIISERDKKLHYMAFAVSMYESDLNPFIHGDGGKSRGCLQIQEGMIDFVNKVFDTHYIYSDRYDVQKSFEMFCLFQNKFNPNLDLDFGFHIWNAGLGDIKNRWKYTESYRYIVNKNYRKILKDSPFIF